jgi:uncharacterized membrane protein YbhN (UPF0104 family)
MKKKVLIAIVLLALGALVYLQFKTWRKFDWKSFREQTEDVNIGLIALGVAIIHFDYYLRALRWKILLRPVCPTKATRLLAPTMIGFTGLALLGRPGEFIRPFLIARKEKLTMSSQLAVWVVERLFDVGAFALIMAVNILWSAEHLKDLPGFSDGASKTISGFFLCVSRTQKSRARGQNHRTPAQTDFRETGPRRGASRPHLWRGTQHHPGRQIFLPGIWPFSRALADHRCHLCLCDPSV